MKFKCCIIILLIPFLSKAQSKTIDSLKKELSLLNDSSRINLLNKISIDYYLNALSETYINVQTDSAIFFASQAKTESIKINYSKGVAEAFQNLGEIARDRNDFATAEKYFRQSIPLFEKINDPEKYSWAHVTLGFALYKQGNFSEAKLAYEKALPYYIITGNKVRQSMIHRLISLTYSARGYNEKAFDNTLQAIRITNKSDARGVISSPENMGQLYKAAGEPLTALAYFRLAAEKAKPSNPVRFNRLMADISLLLNKKDSAIYFYKLSHRYVTLNTSDTVLIKRSLSYTYVNIAEVYIKENKYDLAINLLRNPLLFFENGNDKISIMRILHLLASCYLAKNNYSESFLLSKRLNNLAQQTGARPFLRDAYELYWKIYDRQKITDTAYKYSSKYIAIKDSILSDEYRRNIALSEMRLQDQEQKSKIILLQKDQQLNKENFSLQQQKLKSESLLRYILLSITLAFLLIGIFIFRNINLKRKNEKQQLSHALELQQMESKNTIIEFQQQATELEMQALRAQMNPHFIFNCLSSINRFILINKTQEASDYLTKFSRLIRIALHNSQKPFITLENELEALQLYLELERLRFKNAFNYSITNTNNIDVNMVYIPPMLIQPFTENAIWHGLMHKKAVGKLEIHLFAENKILTCEITDNGIGRDMAASVNFRSAEKNKSLGIGITAGRLALLNKYKNETAALKIEDLYDKNGLCCGTKVILAIPYKEITEVIV